MKRNPYLSNLTYSKHNDLNFSKLFSIAVLILFVANSFAQTIQFSSPGTTTWTVPNNATSIKVECWGAGGAGGGAATSTASTVGSGGGGGTYTTSSITVTPGTTYTILVGAGGTGSTGNGTAGGSSTVNSTFMVAVGGAGGVAGVTGLSQTAGAGGIGSSCTPAGFSGGNGSIASGALASGAGGGGAGSNGAGGNASTVAAGTGTAAGGGNGGAGVTTTNTTGNNGAAAGGGGSGAVSNGSTALAGGPGANGLVQITVLGYQFTASGSWTAPAGINAAIVECWGGGGGGGGTTGNGSAGGGGGGGTYVKGTVPVTALTSYPVSVGAGGTGNSGANGGNGGSSTFNTSSVVAVGGAGGVYGATGLQGALGAGGAAASCTPASGAFSGGNGAAAPATSFSGAGGGGAGSTGNGGNASGPSAGTGTATGGGNGAAGISTIATNGSAGNIYGGGGSGAVSNSSGSTSYTGGAGAAGEVKITPLSNSTYIWSSNSTTSTDFTVATNWTPSRTTPLTSDVLVFQGGLSTYAGGQLLTVTNVPTQTIGALVLSNAKADPPNVRLVGGSPGNTLTIGTATTDSIVSGAKLDIGTNANLIIGAGATFINAGTYTASGGGTTTVNGLFNFTGAGQTAPAGITVNAGGELKFSGTGSPVINAPSISGTLTVSGAVTGITGTSPTYTSTSVLQYTGSSATTGAEIPPSFVVHDLTVSIVSGNTITMNSSITVTGTSNGLKVISGILSIGAHTLTIQGIVTATSGSISGSGTCASILAITSNVSGNIGSINLSGTAPTLGTLNMSCTGTNPTLTLGGTMTICTSVILGGGIVNTSGIFNYEGTAANLSAGSATSFIATANSQYSSGFNLLSGTPATLSAGPYTLPIGTLSPGYGNPVVNGYRPVTLNYSGVPPASSSIQVDFFSDGTGSVDNGDIPTSGNNRAGYLLNLITLNSFFSNFTSISMSYMDADFNAGAPAIGNVIIAEWNSGVGAYQGPYQASNSSSGSLRTITTNNFTIALTSSGNSIVLGVPGTNVQPFGNFTWTGNDFSSTWNDPGNWSGPAGYYPGLSSGDNATVSSTVDSFPIITSSAGHLSLSTLIVSGAGSTVTMAANSYLAVYGTTTTAIQTSSGGTVITDPTSTIEYADGHGPGPLAVPSPLDQIVNSSFTYGNLYLSSGSGGTVFTDKYINAATNITGNLTLATNCGLIATSGTYNINVGGNVAYTGTGGITNTPTTPIIMNTNGSTFNITSGGNINAVTANANISTVGNMTIGNLVTNLGATFTIPNTIILTVNGSLSNSGTIAGPGLLKIGGDAINFPGPGTNNPNLNLQVISLSPTINASTTVTNFTVNASDSILIGSGNTLTPTGTFLNNGTISGPGTLLLNTTTNIPGGTGGSGIFNGLSGSIPNLIVGDGTTTNTVTATAAITTNNLTVNTGAFLSINSGISLTPAGNILCNGTIQNGSGSGTLQWGVQGTSTGTSLTLDGGTSGIHGQINVSLFNLFSAANQTRTVTSSSDFLDFGASTTVGNSSTQENQTFNNNGNLNILGTLAFLNTGMLNDFFNNLATGTVSVPSLTITSSSGQFSNSGLLTCGAIIDANGVSNQFFNLGDSAGFVNRGTVNCTSIAVGATNSPSVFVNNGIVHCTGSGGIIGFNQFSSAPYSQWNNNAGSSVDVAGPFFETYGILTCATTGTPNTVTYDATVSGDLIYKTNYYNLVITGTNVNGNDTLPSSAIGVVGNFVANATFASGGYVTGNDTINMNGTGGQTISTTSPFAFSNLQYSNTGTGVTLQTNATASSNLIFSTAGKIATGVNTLILTNPAPLAAIGGANGTHYVNGNLQFALPAGSTTGLVYPIGTASVYAPSTLDITGVSGAVNVTGATTTGAEPNENNPVANASGIDQTQKCGNYWTMIKSGGGTFGTYNTTFDFTNTANTGTTANYTIRKFDGPSTWSATNGTVAGTTVQATGLTNFSEFEVGVAKQLAMTSCSSTNVTCGGGSNGTATAGTVSGATGTVNYLWSNSATTSAITGLSAGIYTLSVSDNFNTVTCSQTLTAPAILDPSATNNSPSCQTGSVNLGSSVGGGTPGYIYLWSGPSSYSSTNANNTLSNVTPANGGTYTLVVTDSRGCTATTTTAVTVNLCPAILNLNAYIEGYYIGSGQMEPAMYEEHVAGATPTQTDTITVELRNTITPSTIVQSVKAILNTNGTAVVSFGSAAVGNTYWIAIKHRNAIQTWSAAPMSFGLNNSYDFTTSQFSAYQHNLVKVDNGPNIWALYSGDINQDENIDLLDFPPLDTGINTGAFGYNATDLNGDGNTDLQDFPYLDANIGLGIYSHHP